MRTTDDNLDSEPRLLNPATIRSLSVLKPAVSMAHLVFEWVAIFGIAAVTWRHLNLFTYLLAVPLIGARQHSLIILMHEGAHYRLLRSRRWNDVVAEVFTAFPFLLFTMHDYRRNHFPHHRHLNTDQDPDWLRKKGPSWQFPQSRGSISRMLLRDLVGWGFSQFLVATLRLRKNHTCNAGLAAARWAFWALVIAVIIQLDVVIPFLAFWIVPMVTWMQLAFHVRSIAEHFGIHAGAGAYSHTRTVLARPLERLLLGCKNVNYHLEHHLYPSVPFYRLPALHELLMARAEYRESAPISHGYLSMLRECSSEMSQTARRPRIGVEV
jgi:fatty acid desaturase